MVQVTMEFPESAFSALRQTPDDFAKELRLAAAVKWYELGTLSQSKAAEIANISRADFLSALSRFGVSPFQTSTQELTEEFNRE
jgi:predicted HTH domain antitoxin